jgi:hypothetical protein
MRQAAEEFLFSRRSERNEESRFYRNLRVLSEPFLNEILQSLCSFGMTTKEQVGVTL